MKTQKLNIMSFKEKAELTDILLEDCLKHFHKELFENKVYEVNTEELAIFEYKLIKALAYIAYMGYQYRNNQSLLDSHIDLCINSYKKLVSALIKEESEAKTH